MAPTLSVILITKDEEAVIEGCLDSLSWADEIVVVDSGSTDRTRELCEKNSKVRFFYAPWEGFGKQKNRALDKANGEWIFSIDADERVTKELADEIMSVVAHPDCDGYTVRRKNFYRGQWIRHSGWWPDRILRLFRKDSGRFSDRLVHESVELSGRARDLDGCIEHHSFEKASDFIMKTDSYSTLGARMMLEKGKSSSGLNALFRSGLTFFKVLILKRGILDGRAGIVIAVSNAMGVFYRHIKCLELQQDVHEKRQ